MLAGTQNTAQSNPIRVPEPGWEIGNLHEFFQTKSAPVLSDGDGIQLGVKSDLLAWLEDFSQPKSEVPQR